MMRWRKIKHLFVPNHEAPWMISHAANPMAVWQQEGIYRIYFTCRDAQQRSHISYIDVDFNKHFEVVSIANEPVIAPGEPGLFDDSGTAMGYYLLIDNVPHIYYLGWNLKVTVPWLNAIGLAKLNTQTGLFEKVSSAPIMDRSHEDPFSISYPSVLYDDGKYKMWYGSNLAWGKTEQSMQHVIKYAESNDGIHWVRSHHIAVNLLYNGEYALSKPFVIKRNNLFYMWYSYRGREAITSYRIGMAISADGIHWERKDNEVGIDVSASGWDSEMICYPSIIEHNRKTYMLYNGNGYGKTGIGIAELNESI